MSLIIARHRGIYLKFSKMELIRILLKTCQLLIGYSGEIKQDTESKLQIPKLASLNVALGFRQISQNLLSVFSDIIKLICMRPPLTFL